MADNTLSIRLVDDGGGGNSLAEAVKDLKNEIRKGGSSAFNQGGPIQAERNIPFLSAQQKNQAGQVSSYGRGIGGSGLESVFEQARQEIIGTALKTAGTIAFSGQILADSLRLAAFNVSKTTEAMVARVNNREQEARLTEQQQAYGNVGRVAQMGGMGAGAGIGLLVGGPIGAAAGAVIGRVVGGVVSDVVDSIGSLLGENTKQMMAMRDALATRSRELAPHSGAISKELAESEVAQIQRDIGEASVLSTQLSTLAVQQRQLDKLNAIAGTYDKLNQIPTQSKRVEKEITKLNNQLEIMAAVTPGMAEDLKRIREAMEANDRDPLTELEDKGMFRFERPEKPQTNIIDKALWALWNKPIVGDK